MKLSSITKAVLAASVLLVSTTGLATANPMHNYKGEANYKAEAPCPPPPVLRDGFYVGGQLGADNYRVRQKFSEDDGLAFATNRLGANNVVGGLFVGYGQYFDAFYLAGEIFGNYSGANESFNIVDTDVSYHNNFRARGSWGISLLPGYKLNDTLLVYLRGGYNWASLRGRENITVTLPGVPVFTAAGSTSKTRGGWSGGVGMESLIWDNWSLRGEYDYTQYQSFNSAGTNERASDNQLTFGVLYHFNFA